VTDTVDHDDLAEAAQAPKEVHELNPRELRLQFAEMIEYAEHQLGEAIALIRCDHNLAALSNLRRLHADLAAHRRGVRP